MMVGSLLVPGRETTMNRIAPAITVLTLTIAATAPASAGTTWHVSTNGSDSNPGTQTEPYATIQHAMNVNTTVDGDTLLIESGIYHEHSLNPSGKAITIQGSFDGDDTIIDAHNAGRAFEFESGEGPETILKRLVIRNGLNAYGGAIYLYQSSPTIAQCIFYWNSAMWDGGAIFCQSGSNPRLENCQFIANVAGVCGGAIYCEDSSPTFSYCSLGTNSAEYGGGLYLYGNCNPELTDVTIRNNNATYAGGGIRCYVGGGNAISKAIINGGEVCSNHPDQITGTITLGANLPEIVDTCSSSGDVDGDGDVDTNDLAQLRGSLGLCASDTDMDGDTDIEDLLDVVEGWGTTCP